MVPHFEQSESPRPNPRGCMTHPGPHVARHSATSLDGSIPLRSLQRTPRTPPVRDSSPLECHNELTALRHEIATLMKANASLHTRLSNTREPSFGASCLAGVDLEASSTSWIEQRKVLEDCVKKLSGECHDLEVEQTLLETSGEPSLMTLIRDGDDLRARLHATGLARSAAEGRIQVSENALMRTRGELEERRRKVANDLAQDRICPWLVQEVDVLLRELSTARTSLKVADSKFALRRGKVSQEELHYSEVKAEYDAVASANDVLRSELESVREHIETGRQNARTAEVELEELQRKVNREELSSEKEICELRSQASVIERALSECKALADSQRSRTEGVLLEEAAIRISHEERAQEAQRRTDAERDVEVLQAEVEELQAEQADIGRQLSQAQASRSELLAHEKDSSLRSDRALRQLALERSRATEIHRVCQEAVLDAEGRIQVLLQQVRDEQQQNMEVAQELAMARESAGDMSPAGSRERWNSVDRQLREMEALRQWKDDSLVALQNMRNDMGAAQQRYKEQLEYNHMLQEKLGQMGQKARAAMSGFLLPADPGSSDASQAQPIDPIRSDGLFSSTAPLVVEHSSARSAAPPAMEHSIGRRLSSTESILAPGDSARGRLIRYPRNDLPEHLAEDGPAFYRHDALIGPDVPEREETDGRFSTVLDDACRTTPMREGAYGTGQCPRPVDGPFWKAHCERREGRRPSPARRRQDTPPRTRVSSASGARGARAASMGSLRRRSTTGAR